MLGPKPLKGSPVSIHLNLDDADAVVARAVAAGAKVIMPVEERFCGFRFNYPKNQPSILMEKGLLSTRFVSGKIPFAALLFLISANRRKH
jgi:hypothetical protein